MGAFEEFFCAVDQANSGVQAILGEPGTTSGTVNIM